MKLFFSGLIVYLYSPIHFTLYFRLLSRGKLRRRDGDGGSPDPARSDGQSPLSFALTSNAGMDDEHDGADGFTHRENHGISQGLTGMVGRRRSSAAAAARTRASLL